MMMSLTARSRVPQGLGLDVSFAAGVRIILMSVATSTHIQFHGFNTLGSIRKQEERLWRKVKKRGRSNQMGMFNYLCDWTRHGGEIRGLEGVCREGGVQKGIFHSRCERSAPTPIHQCHSP